MAPNETDNEGQDNVVSFRDGTGMPPDRSGSGAPPRKKLSEIRAEEKAAKQSKKQRDEFERALQTPITKAEFQRAMFNVFGSMEKVASEFRKLVVRNEAMQALLYKNGTITREDYEAAAQSQWEWNAQIDAIINMYDTHPLNEVVKVVSDWNNTHDTKIQWQHIDIAPRILSTEDVTLEEKLQIAADLEMPEPFIAEVRRRSQNEYDANAVEELANSFNPEGLLSPEEVIAQANAAQEQPVIEAASSGINTPAPEVID